MTVIVIFGLTLGVICAASLVALLRARRTISALTADLTAARSERESHALQLSHRSALDVAKDEFVSTVSHELRTPLTSIRGALGLLSHGLIGTVDPKAHNLLRIALTNTDRLIRLINDILDLERMESGRAPLQVRRCSLRDLALQAIETMTPLADAAEVRLVLAPIATPEIFFDADPDRILQVLTNLLSNAVKFSPPLTAVRILIQAASAALTITISDQGRGVPESKLEAIFERFQQVEPGDSRQKGGTGLGLAICRSIVQQHGGIIWAERNLGPGVSICAEFPRTQRAPGAPRNPPENARPRSATILVCDDDSDVRAIVTEQLRRQGYRILEADSGEQALELAACHCVDAILLDLFMPGLSGWETLQLLKGSPATAAIPVVILSVLSPTERPVTALDAQGWVQKPFNENLLFAALGRVLHTGDGPASILIVEDDSNLAAVLTSSFEQAGLRVDHGPTRERAIQLCQSAPPDLILLNLGLADGGGFRLVDWLRQQQTLRCLPLVVYSGREVSDREMSQLRLGPTQFLTSARVQPREVEDLVLTLVRRLHAAAPAQTSVA